MRYRFVLLAAFLSGASLCSAQELKTIDPNKVQLSGYHHSELPPALLARIKMTTDTFESIDGISYEMAVDLYKRDVEPEDNLVLWEEMMRAYKMFCTGRCSSADERKDVYTSLLLRTAYPEDEALKRSRLTVLQPSEAEAVMKLYRLPAKPIEVVRTK
jgi:hypothetical protein